MENKQCRELELLSKRFANQYAKGDYEEWFASLYKDCVFVASGEPQLFGANNIVEHFRNHQPHIPLEVLSEAYTAVPLGTNTFVVSGQYVMGSRLSKPHATILFTLAFRYVNKVPKIAYQHMSYDFIRGAESEVQKNQLQKNQPDYLLDATSRLYIRETLIGRTVSKSIPIKTGNSTYYINPTSIIYMQSNDHHTTLYCVDNIIDSAMSISEIEALLPKNFYQVRRGSIVNSIFVTAIRRCEVELVFNTIITVPAPKFTTVKKELEALMNTN